MSGSWPEMRPRRFHFNWRLEFWLFFTDVSNFVTWYDQRTSHHLRVTRKARACSHSVQWGAKNWFCRAEQNKQLGKGWHCFKWYPMSARCPSIRFIWEDMGLNTVFGVWSGKDMLGFVWPDFQVAHWDITGLGPAMVLALDSGVKVSWLRWAKEIETVLLGKMWPFSGVLLPSVADWQLCSSPLEKTLMEKYICGSRLWATYGKAKHFTQKQQRRGNQDTVCSAVWQHWWVQLGVGWAAP